MHKEMECPVCGGGGFAEEIEEGVDAIRASERERVAASLESRARMLSIISRAENNRLFANELALIARELRDNTLGRESK